MIRDDHRKPLTRYSAMGRACSRLARPVTPLAGDTTRAGSNRLFIRLWQTSSLTRIMTFLRSPSIQVNGMSEQLARFGNWFRTTRTALLITIFVLD